jgi:hypothetical protein
MSSLSTSSKKKKMNHSFSEIAVVGLTLILTDQFLDPFLAQSEILRLGKFFLQGAIVLWVDDMFSS